MAREEMKEPARVSRGKHQGERAMRIIIIMIVAIIVDRKMG